MAAASPDLDFLLAEPAAAHLARPSANQYAWHEQECTMFVCIGVATYEGTEYDADGKTDLSRFNSLSPWLATVGLDLASSRRMAHAKGM